MSSKHGSNCHLQKIENHTFKKHLFTIATEEENVLVFTFLSPEFYFKTRKPIHLVGQ